MVIDVSADYVTRQVAISGNEVRSLRTRTVFPKASSINNVEDGDDDGGGDVDTEYIYI